MLLVLQFILHPTQTPSDNLKTKSNNVVHAIKFELTGYAVYLLLFLIEFLFSRLLDYPSLFIDTSKKFEGFGKTVGKLDIILFGVLLIPIIEELAFRAFLNFRKLYVLASVASFSYLTFKIFIFSASTNESRLICAGIGLVIAFISYFAITNATLARLRGNFHLLLFLSNFWFVALHATNYNLTLFEIQNFLILPLVLLPQAIGSINMSYLRIRNGLMWSIAWHSLLNLLFFLPRLLS